MAGPIAIQCPKCKTKLKIKSASSVGKKVPCPKCKQPFVVRPPRKKKKPAPVEEPLDALDSFDEDYGADNFEEDFEVEDDYGAEDDFGEPAPSRRRSGQRSSGGGGRSRRGGKKSGKRRRKKDSSAGLWYAIGGVTVLALLILLAFLFWPSGDGPGGGNAVAGDGGNKIDMSWLPPDAEIVVHAKFNDVWNSALVKEIAAEPANASNIEQLEAQLGFKVDQIKSVTFGMSGLTEGQKIQKEVMKGIDLSDPAKMQENMEKMAARQQEIKELQYMIAVVRTSTKVTGDMLLQSLNPPPQRVEKDDKHYYVRAAGMAQTPTGFFIADSNTVVVGPEKDLVVAMAQGGEDTRRKEFDFVDPEQQVLVAIAPKDPTIFDADEDVKKQVPMLTRFVPESLMKSKKSNMNGISIGLVVSSKVDIQLRGNCKGETEASQIKDDYDSAVTELNSKLSESESSMSEQYPNIMKVAREFMDSLAVNQSGAVLDITATIPADIKSTKEEFPKLVMQMMFSGGGGMPFGPPPGQNNQGGQPTLDPSKIPPGALPNQKKAK